jgi:cytochrome c biogenesis protein CcmG, thiol:disulfide interchange protein DsbE
LSDYRGKVVLINFWATWCEPCRDEMPAIQQLRDKLAGQGLVVLAVDVGEFAARIDAFLKKSGIDLTVLRDHSSEAMKNWRVKGLPTSFVVAPDGRVRYRVDGEFNWADEKVADILAKLATPAAMRGKNWRAQQDSNLRPLVSETNTLSN